MKRGNRLLLVGAAILLALSQFQNCQNSNGLIDFSRQRTSLTSSENAGGTDIYDGKPEPGSYCRAFDALECASGSANIQSIMKVDNNGIELITDNCATTSTRFEFADPAVAFSSYNPHYLGLSRGIFKKCELDSANLPKTEIPVIEEAWCHSGTHKIDVVINRHISTSELEAKIVFLSGASVHEVGTRSIVKNRTASSTVYSSSEKNFDLTIPDSVAQTSLGQVSLVIDEKQVLANLECRQANPLPTIIIERDLELHPSWVDTNRLAGYWKFNEVNAFDGTSILDYSQFGTNGQLLTSDSFNKNNTGGSINFDGVDDLVSVNLPADGHLDFDVRSFSYMAWIRKSGNSGAYDMPLWKGGNSTNIAGWDMECGSGVCSAYVSDGTNLVAAPFAPNGNSFVGRWVHLTAVIDRDSKQLRVYVNGQRTSTADISQIASLSSQFILKIGNGSVNNHPFLGAIDDVAFWNYSLSDSDVENIFRQLRPKFY